MALKDKVPALLQYVNDHRPYLEYNKILLDIFEGNLRPYVEASLKSSLSDDYFSRIRDRMVLINVLKRITQKVSKSYLTNPQRVSTMEINQVDVDYYVDQFKLNQMGQKADEYANLFKGYAWEPFVNQGIPYMRTLPFDRFLPYSDDPVDPTRMTVFIKFMPKKALKKGDKIVVLDVFHAFSDTEFYSFDAEGDVVGEDLIGNDGINPYGTIPFVYGNRGNDKLIPTQDTDILAMTKLVPVMLTDLAGCIMFQCFSVVWGIDVNAENLKMSPNAFWSLKSDKTSDKTPSIGTIKPEADIEKVMEYVINTFTLWLETKGIRVGSLGSLSSGNLASGISKIIDEMDTSEIIQANQTMFKDDEADLFNRVLPAMHNEWLATGQLFNVSERLGAFPQGFECVTTFDPPQPLQDRKTEVETIALEVEKGFMPLSEARRRLYPDLSDEQLDEWEDEIESDSTVEVPDESMDQEEPNDQPDSESPQTEDSNDNQQS